jgi:hypothetical protein
MCSNCAGTIGCESITRHTPQGLPIELRGLVNASDFCRGICTRRGFASLRIGLAGGVIRLLEGFSVEQPLATRTSARKNPPELTLQAFSLEHTI